jgi:hypothetical protein
MWKDQIVDFSILDEYNGKVFVVELKLYLYYHGITIYYEGEEDEPIVQNRMWHAETWWTVDKLLSNATMPGMEVHLLTEGNIITEYELDFEEDVRKIKLKIKVTF